MGRPRLEPIALEDDTPDRRAMRKWLDKQGFTLNSASELLGCTVGFLSAWLLHKVEASPDTWQKWAPVVGCSVRTFADGRVAPNPLETDEDPRPVA